MTTIDAARAAGADRSRDAIWLRTHNATMAAVDAMPGGSDWWAINRQRRAVGVTFEADEGVLMDVLKGVEKGARP